MKKLNLFFLVLFAASLFLLSACGDDNTAVVDDETTVIDPVEEASNALAAYFDMAGNSAADPGFANNSITPSNDLGSELSTAPAGLTSTTYKGAIDPAGSPWYAGWSAYESILSGGNTKAFNTGLSVELTDADMQTAGDNVTWNNTNTYILNGFVFVNEGQTLTIEAGTIIQGKAGEGANASALIVAAGGTIIAEGTAAAPIIFTFEGDNGGQSPTLRGQWGGLIVLGKASLNSTPGTTAIEGIPEEPRAIYGGTADDDNSGIIKYVSIRHGGTLIGADNEINGLTFGGVGSGTTIDYVEIIGNKDDGIEWFGGTAKASHLIAAYCADDALDYDEGYRGTNQFVIVHQDPATDAADRGGEHDGGTDPETGTPYATPKFYNVTSVGNADSRALTFRDNAGGEYHNSIFIAYGKGIDVELLKNQEQDSYQQFVDGNLKLENNVFSNIAAGTEGSDLFRINAPE